MTQTLQNPPVFPQVSPYQLGASLYMPATREDMWQVITREKLPTLNSLIICLEDAVSENDVAMALANVKNLLEKWKNFSQITPFSSINHRPLVFVRPRNVEMLRLLFSWKNIGLIDGFVLPKVDMATLAEWQTACADLPSSQLLMPTLETNLIFNPNHNIDLVIALSETFSQPIFALRIGGNDLLSALKMRRPDTVTLYQTVLGQLVYQLVGVFVPAGFYLTSPVFEHLDKQEIFENELAQDVQNGMVGKTIIHPSQIKAVQQAFAVTQAELNQAKAVLETNAKAVFIQDNSMLEPATHSAWAKMVLQREKVFGQKF